MTSNNKKINALREGIGRLTENLNINWRWLKTNFSFIEGEYTPAYASYMATLKTIELLGGDWQRDENGRHKVFIAGVTCEVNDNED